MAPSNDGRPGFSRRAQYSIFTGYVLAGLGIVGGFVLLAISLINPEAFSGPRGVAGTIAEPIGQTSAAARTGAVGFFDSVAGYFRAGPRNAELERQLRIAQGQIIQARAIQQENLRLKALLGLTSDGEPPVARARMIGATAASSRRFALIDAGRSKGVEGGQPVRTDLGLVGRVLEVGPSTARVLLISDAASTVPVRRASDGVPAFAQGVGDGTLQVRLINLGPNPLKKGDVLVTSGSGGLFHPNVPVAVITSLLRDGGIARIISDPAATEFVTVERAWSASIPPPPQVAAAASEPAK